MAEKYGVGLIDLNYAETEELRSPEFQRFESIFYPKILKDSFVISLPFLKINEEFGISASLDSMLGAFPARQYKGFFSSRKNKLDKHQIKYQIHDIIKCKLPELAIIDASEKNLILIGQPLEMDKQAAKLLDLDWKNIPHLRLIDESIVSAKKKEQVAEQSISK